MERFTTETNVTKHPSTSFSTYVTDYPFILYIVTNSVDRYAHWTKTIYACHGACIRLLKCLSIILIWYELMNHTTPNYNVNNRCKLQRIVFLLGGMYCISIYHPLTYIIVAHLSLPYITRNLHMFCTLMFFGGKVPVHLCMCFEMLCDKLPTQGISAPFLWFPQSAVACHTRFSFDLFEDDKIPRYVYKITSVRNINTIAFLCCTWT